MKVVIVEDSKVIRERLKTMLSESTKTEIVGEAESEVDAVKLISKLKPDVAILDIRLTNGSGIDVLQKIKSKKKCPKVIMLTNYPYPQYKKKCIDAGADFFFDKSTEFEKISNVINNMK